MYYYCYVRFQGVNNNTAIYRQYHHCASLCFTAFLQTFLYGISQQCVIWDVSISLPSVGANLRAAATPAITQQWCSFYVVCHNGISEPWSSANQLPPTASTIVLYELLQQLDRIRNSISSATSCSTLSHPICLLGPYDTFTIKKFCGIEPWYFGTPKVS